MKTTFSIAGIDVSCNQKISDYVKIPGYDYQIPVTIINGKENGKVFLITAAIHGFEYPSIEAAIELCREIEPDEMNGAIVILPIINISGFYGRYPYICPDDEKRKNLNKLAPGKKHGTYGEQLIYFLEENFVAKADFHLDLHSGDATEDLFNFAAAGNAPEEHVRKYIYEVIRHTSFEYYTQSSGVREFYNGSVIYKGVPSVMFEVGGSGKWNKYEVAEEKRNILRIARYLKILPGEVKCNEKQSCLKVQSWIECGATGIFYSFVKVGDRIKKGQKIYEICDVYGNKLEEHYANHNGKIMIINRTLGVSKGDDAVFYANEE